MSVGDCYGFTISVAKPSPSARSTIISSPSTAPFAIKAESAVSAYNCSTVEILRISPASARGLARSRLTGLRLATAMALFFDFPRAKRQRSHLQRKLNVSVDACSSLASLVPLLGVLLARV